LNYIDTFFLLVVMTERTS